MVGVLVNGGNVLDDLAGMSYQVAELAGWLGDGTSEVVGGGSSSDLKLSYKHLKLSHKLPQGVTEVHAQILVPIKIMIIYHLRIWFYLQWNWIH